MDLLKPGLMENLEDHIDDAIDEKVSPSLKKKYGE